MGLADRVITMNFNPKALYVTAASIGLMALALSGNTVAVAALLIAEGLVYFGVFGAYGRRKS